MSTIHPQSPAPGDIEPLATADGLRKTEPEASRRLLTTAGPPLAVGVVLMTMWWVATHRQWLSPLLLPPPDEVASSLAHGLFIDGTWWPHIRTTVLETLAGLLIGLIVGLVAGAAFSFMKVARIALMPYIIALQSFPKIAIAPLLIVALGYGLTSKIVVAALLAYFPIMTAAYAGFTELNPDELNLMRSMKASRWQELRYLRIPNAMSYLFPSFDVAIVSALLGAVAAEFVGARYGLGYLLVERQVYADTASIFAVLILLATLGISLRFIISILRLMIPRSIVPR